MDSIDIDRISSLPDSLLHHIMSFLQAQEAVQTCVLSKRWKHLWASLQHLQIDLLEYNTTSENIDERFTNFINALLLLRDASDLQTFRLIFHEYGANISEPTVMMWILYAIKRNAKVIKINFHQFEMLPQCVFNCASLVDLSLCMSSIDEGIGSRVIDLPRLKKLKLMVATDDSDILNKLALGCPALEFLNLVWCNIDVSVVSFPKLTYLRIYGRWVNDMSVKLVRAPKLVTLELDGPIDMFAETALDKMPSLMNATISLILHGGGGCFDEQKCNLLPALANVQTLELAGSAIKALLEMELSKCPTFFNLTTLHLKNFCMVCYCQLNGGIFKRSPNLKRLILRGETPALHWCECATIADEHSNSIKSALLQCKKLEQIEVQLISSDDPTLQLVKSLAESLAELRKAQLSSSVVPATFHTCFIFAFLPFPLH